MFVVCLPNRLPEVHNKLLAWYCCERIDDGRTLHLFTILSKAFRNQIFNANTSSKSPADAYDAGAHCLKKTLVLKTFLL